jgi:BirA family transcriptional regulator, biotin operon repressor / biotin---[acetyl-CoA-carboxylase] ligase
MASEFGKHGVVGSYKLAVESSKTAAPIFFVSNLDSAIAQTSEDTSGLAPFPPWLCWVESCPSTNTWAMSHSTQLHHGDVVFTRQQTAGRGQQGRIWYAPPGVITASFILDRVPVSQLPGLSLAAGLATTYAVEDLMPGLEGKLQLKWPNDILIDMRKVAGILCEATPGERGRRVVIGIGLNRQINFELARLNYKDLEEGYRAIANPISLHEVSCDVPDEIPLLGQLRHYLLQVADMLRRAEGSEQPSGLTLLLPELRRRDILLGQDISLDLGEKIVTGRAMGINESGQLLLRLPDNRICAFSSGRVKWH